MNNDTITDQSIGNAGTRPDCAVAANSHPWSNDCAGRYDRARADLGVGADDDPRINDDAFFQSRSGVDERTGREA
jgi:hypothetical protein